VIEIKHEPHSTPISPLRLEPIPWGDGAHAAAQTAAESGVSARVWRELPDVTGFLVMLVVTVGLFVVPVGATLMQGPAIVASLFAR
jgi:hypothetical protein